MEIELQPYPWQDSQWQGLTRQHQGDRLAHAYLLVGERGLGKKHFAFLTAAYLLCAAPVKGAPCGHCRSCQLLGSASNPDLLVVEPEDSKVVKIDQVRELTEFASRTSHNNSRKVVILHCADALNINAANALLKTLEEPPGSTVLLLVSDNPGRLLPTIRSRCQRILFTCPDSQVALQWLQQRVDTREQLSEVLALSANRPLQALELLKSEDLQHYSNVLTALAALLIGRLDPVEFATQGRQIGAEKIMDWLWQTTSLVVKRLLCQDSLPPASREVDLICRQIAEAKPGADEMLARLLRINRAADEARRQLTGASNPNAQLVLESILWRWARVTL